MIDIFPWRCATAAAFTIVALIAVAGCATASRTNASHPTASAESDARLNEVELMPISKLAAVERAPKDLILLPAPRTCKIMMERFWVSQTPPKALLRAPLSVLEKRAFVEALFWVRQSNSERRVKEPSINVILDAKAMPHEQGYRLAISAKQISITAHDDAGVFYAIMTLRQIARQYAGLGWLPAVRVEDWPDFPHRGAMLDVARCKVPEMETLYRLVDMFAEWKFNQLQLYTEHTFAYEGHHTVWEDASPMTPAQIRALDVYCKSRFIELVPNQNSFGHMGRWLTHPEYAHLAETPGGSDLCPVDPGSIALLTSMYDQLLPLFSSSQMNVGCDETGSIGKGRSKDAVEKIGVGRVYFDFLMQIRALCSKHNKTMQFWGDIIMQHPELIPAIPKGVTAMEWGYEAKHPFAEHGKKFAASHIPFYVVPGTSTWNSFVGRTDNAMENLRNAAQNGLANGAIGYLVTDWGDGGHWQFLPASYLGFAYGAAVSWAYDANRNLDTARALDILVFGDSMHVMGKLAYDLGNAYRIGGYEPGNSSVFYTLIHTADGPLPDEITREGLQKTISYIDGVSSRLPGNHMNCEDAGLIAREFSWSSKMMEFVCRLGIARIQAERNPVSELPKDVRANLANELRPLIPEFRQIWLERNRSGGLKESTGTFESLLAALEK